MNQDVFDSWRPNSLFSLTQDIPKDGDIGVSRDAYSLRVWKNLAVGHKMEAGYVTPAMFGSLIHLQLMSLVKSQRTKPI